MPRVGTFKSSYTPKSILFQNEKGEYLRNDQFPPEEQVTVFLTYADVEQKAQYLQHYTEGGAVDELKVFSRTQYNEALRTHIQRIVNLNWDGGPITNGVELVACKSPDLNDFKIDLFNRVMGVRYDEADPEPGALFAGESEPSN